jgi:hypothetical protein
MDGEPGGGTGRLNVSRPYFMEEQVSEEVRP